MNWLRNWNRSQQVMLFYCHVMTLGKLFRHTHASVKAVLFSTVLCCQNFLFFIHFIYTFIYSFIVIKGSTPLTHHITTGLSKNNGGKEGFITSSPVGCLETSIGLTIFQNPTTNLKNMLTTHKKDSNTLNMSTSVVTSDQCDGRQTQQTSPVHFVVLQSATNLLHDFRGIKRLQQLTHRRYIGNLSSIITYMRCLLMSCIPLIRWRHGRVLLIRWCCGRVSDLRPEVVSSSLGRALRRKNSGQVSHTYVPLSPSSISLYRR